MQSVAALPGATCLISVSFTDLIDCRSCRTTSRSASTALTATRIPLDFWATSVLTVLRSSWTATICAVSFVGYGRRSRQSVQLRRTVLFCAGHGHGRRLGLDELGQLPVDLVDLILRGLPGRQLLFHLVRAVLRAQPSGYPFRQQRDPPPPARLGQTWWPCGPPAGTIGAAVDAVPPGSPMAEPRATTTVERSHIASGVSRRRKWFGC